MQKVSVVCGLILLVTATTPTRTASSAESPQVPAAQTSRQPNIIFFFADDQRHDTLGCAGHPVVKTPTIDSLAARGVRFENMMVSHSICWVSRTTILTGLTARSFGTTEQPDRARPETVETLFSDHLRTAGYRTGFFGKWHAKMPAGYRPQEHFDVFRHIGRNPYFHRQADGSLRHETELVVDGGMEFLQSQPADQPFALNLWFNAGHAEDGDRRPGVGHYPWPQAVDGLYDDLQMPPPRLSAAEIYESQPNFLKESLNRERFFWRWDTPEKYQLNMRAYLRMLSGIDGAMRRLLNELERLGMADNTIIVYSADNGYYMGDRGFAGKWSHYDQSLRVPLIIYDPRQPQHNRGRVLQSYALNLDLPCTFLQWAGVTIPDTYQGRSLVPLLDGAEPEDWRTETFHEHVTLRPNLSWEGLRNKRFKYARYFDQQPAYEFLFDLQRDPDELHNVAGQAAYASDLQELRERLTRTVDEYGGPLPPL
ncbi:MAG: sulfatase [Planctomycetales bacterium]|nr:sulfatase [Planctomycetales bacterium]